MGKLLELIISRFIKRTWYIHIYHQDDFIIIEVTDHSYPWVNTGLLRDVIALAFRGFNYVAISQFVDKEQWDIGDKEAFIRAVTEDYSLPIVISKKFGTIEAGSIDDNTFVLNLVGRPEKPWLERVVMFGMSNNPNILYGLHSFQENWFFQITNWNFQFRRWFDLLSDSVKVKEIMNEIELMSWNSDNHQCFAVKGEDKKDKLLECVSQLADKKSLSMIVRYERGGYAIPR